MHLKETADAPPLLPNASSIVEIVAGFPTCPKSDNFTILGDTRDAVLLPDGGLEIDGVALPSGQFCVERIKELNQVAKVFACPEHAPQRLVPPLRRSRSRVRDIYISLLAFRSGRAQRAAKIRKRR